MTTPPFIHFLKPSSSPFCDRPQTPTPSTKRMALVVVRVDELVERLLHLLVAGRKLGDGFLGFLLETEKVGIAL